MKRTLILIPDDGRDSPKWARHPIRVIQNPSGTMFEAHLFVGDVPPTDDSNIHVPVGPRDTVQGALSRDGFTRSKPQRAVKVVPGKRAVASPLPVPEVKPSLLDRAKKFFTRGT